MINSIEKPYKKKEVHEWEENWQGAVNALNESFYGLIVNKGIRDPNVTDNNDNKKIRNLTIIKELTEYQEDDFAISEFIYENEGIGVMEVENDFLVKEDDLSGVGEMAVEKDFKIYL